MKFKSGYFNLNFSEGLKKPTMFLVHELYTSEQNSAYKTAGLTKRHDESVRYKVLRTSVRVLWSCVFLYKYSGH